MASFPCKFLNDENELFAFLDQVYVHTINSFLALMGGCLASILELADVVAIMPGNTLVLVEPPCPRPS